MCFFPVGLSLLIQHFQTGLVGVEVSSVNCPSLEREETATPTRTVENVVLTTKVLQEIYTQVLDGTTVKNR